MALQWIYTFPNQSWDPYVPPDFTLGLPNVGDWPKWTWEVPWVLDPAEHPPRPAIQSHHESTGPSSGDERQKRRKKKKHCQPKKQELKVTTRGKGDDIPVWTHTRSNFSSSSESQTEGDSGISSSYQKPPGGAGSTTRHDHTPRYSPETIRKIDRGDPEDAPLSDHGGNNDGDQEMVSRDEGVKEVTGTNPYGQLDPQPLLWVWLLTSWWHQRLQRGWKLRYWQTQQIQMMKSLLGHFPAHYAGLPCCNPHSIWQIPTGVQRGAKYCTEVHEEIHWTVGLYWGPRPPYTDGCGPYSWPWTVWRRV